MGLGSSFELKAHGQPGRRGVNFRGPFGGHDENACPPTCQVVPTLRGTAPKCPGHEPARIELAEPQARLRDLRDLRGEGEEKTRWREVPGTSISASHKLQRVGGRVVVCLCVRMVECSVSVCVRVCSLMSLETSKTGQMVAVLLVFPNTQPEKGYQLQNRHPRFGYVSE